MHVMMIPEGVVIILIGMNIQIWGKYFTLDIEAENSLKRRSLLNEYFLFYRKSLSFIPIQYIFR